MLSCPICHGSIVKVDQNHIQCASRHAFDFAKQGYINVMTRNFKGNYGKRLFTAKRRILSETDVYAPLGEKLRAWVADYSTETSHPVHIMDAGAGEGTFLNQITKDTSAVGWGLDIAKEGIALAASAYPQQIWFVGDLACNPFVAGQMDLILNILSPSNYEEFRRIRKAGGWTIKVIPRERYLIEMRELLFPDRFEHKNSFDHTFNRFAKYNHVLATIPLTYTQPVPEHLLESLIHMTPLSWHATESGLARMKDSLSEITIDVEILVGTSL
ncbi:putative RNA methyltransferase [Paenibacillus xylanilyticus]|uniref:putative RNA methyltransferase n=1 Tax=Paenibacillus xylanilyticus TaxID=248903 RepID=UPI0039A0B9AC